MQLTFQENSSRGYASLVSNKTSFPVVLLKEIANNSTWIFFTIFTYSSQHIAQVLADCQFVGNKAKARISKLVFQENNARQIFRKINISYRLIRVTLSTLLFMFHLIPFSPHFTDYVSFLFPSVHSPSY